MAPLLLPARWLPHSLRNQFISVVSALITLILAGGMVAVYAMYATSSTIRQLTEERLVQMQVAQDLVQRTLLVERASYELSDAASPAEMRLRYDGMIRQLAEFDSLVDKLASNTGDAALLDLHESSQNFRNTVHVAAQVLGRELRAGAARGITSTVRSASSHHYRELLRQQAGALLSAARFQSDHFTSRYREAMERLDDVTRRNARWVMALMVGSLLLAGLVAQWFLGHHVLGRLLQVSRSLRISADDAEGSAPAAAGPRPRDEIDEMAHAVELFWNDRRQLKQRKEELRLARDAAEAANRAKSVFLANMSHELRTPLNAILGFSNILRNDPQLAGSLHQYLEIISRSGEHLLSLINDVLEMAKIEAGRVQVTNAPFDLGGLIREVTELMELRAQEKGLQLFVDQSSSFPRYIVGDEARVRQVLINLVGNAVKFTEHGRVVVRLATRENLHGHLIIEVEDTGPGISPNDQLRLFEPFTQLGGRRDSKGTGLGLAITRQFVEMMGGTIGLTSTFGAGSRFRVELPLTAAEPEQVARLRPDATVFRLAGGQPEFRILVVEDQAENRLLLQILLESAGFRVHLVGDGAEGVAGFTEWRPHLILMDRKMPVMDGMEATRQIRALPGGDAVKIVAVTASAFEEERDEMLAAGMDDFVRKPFRAGEIFDCIERQLGARLLHNAAEEVALPQLSAGMLAPLPRELRARLRDALESLKADAIATVIGEVGTFDPELERRLSRIADGFDYQAILNALAVENEGGAARH